MTGRDDTPLTAEPVSPALTGNEKVDALLRALMDYEQVDMDGVFCKVSRQAVHEAYTLIQQRTLQPSLGTNNGLAGSADRHKGSGEVCGPVKMGSTPIGSAVSPVAPRGDYIRTCANGHASLNAANWECPWCLLDEARRELAELRAAPRIYDAVADAVCEIADAAKAAFEKAGVDPGEWDSDDIVQDVKRGIVSAIEQLAAARSATGKRLPTAAEVRGILKDDDAPSLDTTAKP